MATTDIALSHFIVVTFRKILWRTWILLRWHITKVNSQSWVLGCAILISIIKMLALLQHVVTKTSVDNIHGFVTQFGYRWITQLLWTVLKYRDSSVRRTTPLAHLCLQCLFLSDLLKQPLSVQKNPDRPPRLSVWTPHLTRLCCSFAFGQLLCFFFLPFFSSSTGKRHPKWAAESVNQKPVDVLFFVNAAKHLQVALRATSCAFTHTHAHTHPSCKFMWLEAASMSCCCSETTNTKWFQKSVARKKKNKCWSHQEDRLLKNNLFFTLLLCFQWSLVIDLFI